MTWLTIAPSNGETFSVPEGVDLLILAPTLLVLTLAINMPPLPADGDRLIVKAPGIPYMAIAIAGVVVNVGYQIEHAWQYVAATNTWVQLG